MLKLPNVCNIPSTNNEYAETYSRIVATFHRMQYHNKPKAGSRKRESTYCEIQDDMRGKMFLHRHNVVPLTKYRAVIVNVRNIDHNLNLNLVIWQSLIFSYNPNAVLVSVLSI